MIEKKKEKENPQNKTENYNELTFEKSEAGNLETHLIHWSPYLEENDSHFFPGFCRISRICFNCLMSVKSSCGVRSQKRL